MASRKVGESPCAALNARRPVANRFTSPPWQSASSGFHFPQSLPWKLAAVGTSTGTPDVRLVHFEPAKRHEVREKRTEATSTVGCSTSSTAAVACSSRAALHFNQASRSLFHFSPCLPLPAVRVSLLPRLGVRVSLAPRVSLTRKVDEVPCLQERPAQPRSGRWRTACGSPRPPSTTSGEFSLPTALLGSSVIASSTSSTAAVQGKRLASRSSTAALHFPHLAGNGKPWARPKREATPRACRAPQCLPESETTTRHLGSSPPVQSRSTSPLPAFGKRLVRLLESALPACRK